MNSSHNSSDAKPKLSNPIHLLAFGFGSGCLPKAPGTWGTLVGIPFYLALVHLPLWGYIAATLVLALIGIWLCHVTARDLNVHDHPGIVWDEIVGYLITMTAAPLGMVWIVVGFILFRIFDIWKPFPIRLADKGVGGGFGIMLDDVLAGFYAAFCLQGIVYLTL